MGDHHTRTDTIMNDSSSDSDSDMGKKVNSDSDSGVGIAHLCSGGGSKWLITFRDLKVKKWGSRRGSDIPI